MASLGMGTALRITLALSLLDPIVQLDHAAQRAVQSLRPTPLEGAMRAVTDVGRPHIVLGALLAVAAFSGPAGPATARRAVAALVPTNVAVEVTKRSVNRTRPDGERKRSNASFPSSHAANAFALAAVFAWRWRKATLWFFLFAVTVGISRVYLNRHFVSDVLFGAAVGVGCAWAVGAWIDRWRRARSAESTEAGR